MTLPRTEADQIGPHVRHLSDRLGLAVRHKAEHLQDTGAFRLRGATHALRRLPPPARAHGMVTTPTGSHGRALAHAAALPGTRAVVCLSRLVPANKVAVIRDPGAEVRIAGTSHDEAMAAAGLVPGRTAPDQTTLANLTGTGVQDTAIAALALSRVRAAAAGQTFTV